MDEPFTLYNLEVSVLGDPSTFICSHKPGVAFRVEGENLIFDANNSFSMYALAALLPLLPVKQRETHANDWITSDELIACPDPHCGATFQIARTGKQMFNRYGRCDAIVHPQD
jgi:uncharacterized repeat protein (TIGR04076 family)